MVSQEVRLDNYKRAYSTKATSCPFLTNGWHSFLKDSFLIQSRVSSLWQGESLGVSRVWLIYYNIKKRVMKFVNSPLWLVKEWPTISKNLPHDLKRHLNWQVIGWQKAHVTFSFGELGQCWHQEHECLYREQSPSSPSSPTPVPLSPRQSCQCWRSECLCLCSEQHICGWLHNPYPYHRWTPSPPAT